MIGALRVNRAQTTYVHTVSLPGKRTQSYLFTDTLVYTIAHWSGPPRSYVDFSQRQQSRLVYVRATVADTCIKI